MADSVREKIFAAIIYGLKQITTASGYNYTVRQVYDPPIGIDDMKEYPAINIDDGDENCANSSTGNHLQTGGNEALLHNSFTVILDCVVSDINFPRKARNKILADIQRYFGIHWNIPDNSGIPTAFNCFYQRSTPWGVYEKRKDLTGITIEYIVWYRQYLTNPSQSS